MNTGVLSEIDEMVKRHLKLKPVSPNDFPLIDPRFVELYEACRVVGAALDVCLTCGIEPNPRTLALRRLSDAIGEVLR